MELILQLLPYIGTVLVALAGNFLITKSTKKYQLANAKDAEWKVWKDQLDHAAQKLREANAANDEIMRKWNELSKLHEDSVKDAAQKAIIIANQQIEIAKVTSECNDAKQKAEKYKNDNIELLKALEEVPKMKKKMSDMATRISTLEDQLCNDNTCKTRRK